MNTNRKRRIGARLAALAGVTLAMPSALGLGFSDLSLLPPTGAVGRPYRHQLDGRAGSPPYSFKIDSGKLPAGLTLATNGLISGTATASGNYKIWANLADSWGKHSERQISITIFEAQPPQAPALEKPGWTVAWHDEFDESTLNRDRWIAAYRGNPALPAHWVSRDGVMRLRIDQAAPASGAGRSDRVSGIETRRAGQPFAQQYGWFEMRARTPKGAGVMAAFWMSPLDSDYERLQSDGGKRATAGEAAEIDIFEQLGRETNSNNHTVHFGRSWAEGHQAEHRRIDLPFSPQEDFHVYALEWNMKALVWYVDGLEVHRSNKTAHTPFFLRVSVYEGDDKWRGAVDRTMPYPKDFEIDYVRVYRLTEMLLAPPEAGERMAATSATPVANGNPARSAAPYPPSPVLQGIEWAPRDTILRQARGSDNWPMTWADDDALYTAYGDGNGFEPFLKDKLSLGLARVIGTPPDIRGINIRSATAKALGGGQRGRKASGMLCVDGLLHMLVRNTGNAQLGWSTDHGATWAWADWKFAGSFGCPTFLNFGKDCAGARDGFVYIYSHDHDSAYERADRFVMARVPKGRLRERAAYEFFVKLDANSHPRWSRSILERGAVFVNPGACYRSALSYSAALKRYLWCQIGPGNDTRYTGGFAIYDAPEPWGPWTTAFHTDAWDVGPGESSSLPTKWMSTDGRTVHLVFSGEDHFSVRKGTVLLRETPKPFP
jgi:beta-glucanase (GH16 family)